MRLSAACSAGRQSWPALYSQRRTRAVAAVDVAELAIEIGFLAGDYA